MIFIVILIAILQVATLSAQHTEELIKNIDQAIEQHTANRNKGWEKVRTYSTSGKCSIERLDEWYAIMRLDTEQREQLKKQSESTKSLVERVEKFDAKHADLYEHTKNEKTKKYLESAKKIGEIGSRVRALQKLRKDLVIATQNSESEANALGWYKDRVRFYLPATKHKNALQEIGMYTYFDLNTDIVQIVVKQLPHIVEIPLDLALFRQGFSTYAPQLNEPMSENEVGEYLEIIGKRGLATGDFAKHFRDKHNLKYAREYMKKHDLFCASLSSSRSTTKELEQGMLRDNLDLHYAKYSHSGVLKNLLHMSFDGGHYEFCRKLIEKGLDINRNDFLGYMIHAVYKKKVDLENPDVIRLIDDAMDYYQKNINGEDMLQYTLRNITYSDDQHYDDVIAFLIDRYKKHAIKPL